MAPPAINGCCSAFCGRLRGCFCSKEMDGWGDDDAQPVRPDHRSLTFTGLGGDTSRPVVLNNADVTASRSPSEPGFD